MSSWKDQVDRDQARQREELRKQTAIEDARRAEESRKRDEERQRAHESKVAEHIARYKCHICGTPSKGPYYDESYTVSSHNVGSGENTTPDYYHHGKGWMYDRPTSLATCSQCHRWTCDNDMKGGKCSRCWGY
jgi:hypothetical protein